MRKLLRLIAVTLIVGSAGYSGQSYAGDITLAMEFQPWSAKVINDMGGSALEHEIPQAVETVIMRKINIPVVRIPGETHKVQERIEAGRLKAEFTVYTVMPPASSGYGAYLSMKTEILAPVRAICFHYASVSFDPNNKLDLAPMVCSAYEEKTKLLWGLTLNDKP